MKKLIQLTLRSSAIFLFGVLAIIPARAATVSVVATASSGLNINGWTPGGNTLTWTTSLTVPAQRIDGMLVVMVAGEGGATSLNITWAGTPLTLQRGASGSAYAFVYALAQPVAGTGPLIVNAPGGNRYGVAAIYATGVLGLESSDAINLGGVATLTTGLITPTAGALVVSAGGHTEGSFPIPPPGMTGSTLLMDLTVAGSGGAVDYLIAPDSTPLSATYNRAGTGGRVSGVIASFAAGRLTPAADIVAFGPGGNITGTNIAWSVPFGSDLTKLAPTYTLSPEATCDHDNGITAYDFSSPSGVDYVVSSAAPVITKTYNVKVTVLPNETTIIWNTGSGAWDFVATNWTGQTFGSTLPFWNGVNVLFDDTASGGTVSIAAGMLPASTTVRNRDYTFSGGPIAGTGPLIKAGSGTLTLAGANTYSGNTAVNGGTLVANGKSALGGTTNFTVDGGATLLLSGTTGAYTWPAIPATLTGAGTVSIPIGGGINVGLNFDMRAFTGILDLSNGMACVNATYSPSFVNPTNGTIKVEPRTTLYLGWYAGRLNTTVQLMGGPDNGENLGQLRSDNADIQLDGAVILGANSTIGSAFTINAVISDGGKGFGFTKISSGTVVLTATNTYSGTNFVTTGTLQCNNPNAMGTGALSISGSGTVNLNYTGDHVVTSLTLGGVLQPPGTYGSSSSPATPPDDIHFIGTGTVTVVPEAPLTITAVIISPPVDGLVNVDITFTNTVKALFYLLQYTDSLPVELPKLWGEVGGPIQATGTGMTVRDAEVPTGTNPQRFYRVKQN